MTRNLLLCAMLLISSILFAQQPVLTFTTPTTHDFGKINEADGRVSTIFEFKNEGMAPLVLSNVKASCGCTTPTWTKTPVEPGQTGSITVTYNPNGRPGKFQKTVTITSNAEEPSVKVFIKGEVIPKSAQPVNKYPFKMGEASVSAKSVNFGNVLNTTNLTKTIEYSNNTDQPITIAVAFSDAETWVNAEASLVKVEPKKAGTLSINIDGTACKVWGQRTSYIYLIVNGKGNKQETNKITLLYNIEEDFSKVNKATAPILELSAKELNLGVIEAGKSVTKALTLKNVGPSDPLYIRAINNSNAGVKVAAAKSIKHGKSSAAKVTVNAGNEPGTFKKQIEIITNDPQNSHVKVTLVWSVK